MFGSTLEVLLPNRNDAAVPTRKVAEQLVERIFLGLLIHIEYPMDYFFPALGVQIEETCQNPLRVGFEKDILTLEE